MVGLGSPSAAQCSITGYPSIASVGFCGWMVNFGATGTNRAISIEIQAGRSRRGIEKETLTDYVDTDRVVDRSLGVAGYARVSTLVFLENSIEMKSSIDILHVLGEFFA